MNREQHIQVSILMPIYKVEQYIEKTLDSIFTQTYPYLDYVFVNDCSPDNSLQILMDTIKKHNIDAARYTIINHAQNEGVAVSRTDCLANAKGDYVFFVDSDDWIEKGAVEIMVGATKGGTIDIVGCDYIDEYGNNRTSYHYEHYFGSCYENLVGCINYDLSPVLWKLLVRRSLFDNFSITPGLNIGEDYAISVKLYFYAKSFVALKRALYHYVHYNQQKLSFHRKQSLKDHIMIVREVEDFLKHNDMFSEDIEFRLKLRKFNIKSNFLTKQTLDYCAYKKTFPDVNYMWRYLGYKKTERFKFWLAEKKMFLILSILQKLWNSL